MKFLEGKKTYLTAAVTAAVAAAQVLGYEIPPYVLTILGAFGLYSLRSAVGR
jgi:hypothetical protein